MDNNIFNIKENSLSYGRGYVYSLQKYLPHRLQYTLCGYCRKVENILLYRQECV